MTFAMLPDLPDGVYFDLPDDVYFAIPRLSGSGLKSMIVSPATFWAGSWLNAKKAAALAGACLAAMTLMPPGAMSPALAEFGKQIAATFPDAAGTAKDAETTKAMHLGRAYHAARLEGSEALFARFARQPERADFPAEGALWTGPDIERELAARDEPKKKAGESVADQGRRLADLGYEGTIFPLEMAKFQASLNGRVPIAAAIWDDLIIDMDRLRESEVADLLSGGVAEVSVLWTDRNGIKMKCRIDYLMPDKWTDFKTFDNKRGKHLEQAILDAFRYDRHYIQGIVYREAVELLRVDALPIVGPSTEHQRQVLGRLATVAGEPECWFVYQEKNGVPNILGRRMEFYDVPLNTRIQHAGATEEGIAAVEEATRTVTFLHRRGREEINKAKADFAAYQEIYEAGRPWQPWNAKRTIDDLDFPEYWLRNE